MKKILKNEYIFRIFKYPFSTIMKELELLTKFSMEYCLLHIFNFKNHIIVHKAPKYKKSSFINLHVAHIFTLFYHIIYRKRDF